MTTLKLLPTSPALWAGRQNPLSMDYTKLRQCRLGESRRVATARIASRINALCVSDVYQINELVRVAKDWQQAAALKYASPSHPWGTLGRSDRAERTCVRGENGYIVVR